MVTQLMWNSMQWNASYWMRPGLESLEVAGDTNKVRASPPKRPSEGVRRLLGVEHEPMRRAVFSSSLFFRQAALGSR